MIRPAAALSLAFLGVSLCTTAHAGPLKWAGLDPDDLAWFYNRPGATAEAVAADHNECLRFGRGKTGADSPDFGAQYGLVGMAMGAIVSAGAAISFSDDCMISKGYRRFNVGPTPFREFQQRLHAMAPEVQALYAGAETPPEGELARVWVNSYWLPAEGEPQPAAEPRSFSPRVHSLDAARQLNSARRTLRPAAADAALVPGPGEAMLFLTVRSPSGKSGGLFFDRDNFENGEPDLTPVAQGRERPITLEARARGDTSLQRFAFIVPAGAYSFAEAWLGRTATFFCYGTPVFRAGAGEVLDLGEFTLAPGREPVISAAPAPELRLRIDQPAVDAQRASLLGGEHANRLKPVTYFNHFPHRCPLIVITYGFDIPGAASWSANASNEAAAPDEAPQQ